MATDGEELEYETDPEEITLPLAMRRREASDDEDRDRSEKKPIERVLSGSDGESDDQGGVHFYVDEESEIEEEEVEDEDGDDYATEEDEFYEDGSVRADHAVAALEANTTAEFGTEDKRSIGRDHNSEEEKKENEPFAVPKAGAFYMHDDRFKDNGNSRFRRNGGHRLWESKDNRAWVHDRFEQLNLRDARNDEERRKVKGRFRGRGRYQRRAIGHVRANETRNLGDIDNQNRSIKSFRGRGPRRYESLAKNDSEMSALHVRQAGKSVDAASSSDKGKLPPRVSNVKHDPVLSQKHVFASSLNSASPPFYPSGSSNQETYITRKRDTLNKTTGGNFEPSVIVKESVSTSLSTSSRGKTIAEPNGLERSIMDRITPSIGGKPLNSVQLQHSDFSALTDARQSAQGRNQVRSPIVNGGRPNFQSSASLNRGSAQAQKLVFEHRSTQSPVQPISRGSSQELLQHPVSVSQGSLIHASLTNLPEAREMESTSDSNKSKTVLAGKDKDMSQGSGKVSLLYDAAHVVGATGPMSLPAHGDQNFPAMFPVMQFGGQNNGGLGVPAVGMAFPGYFAQPQLGLRNSEMTWMPILAGAAGGLGASYCSPYIAVDGGLYNRVPGQTSSVGDFKEISATKPANARKPPQKPELTSDEFGQRQNKPRRYSEMSFSQ